MSRIRTDDPSRRITHPRNPTGSDDAELHSDQIRSDPAHPFDPLSALLPLLRHSPSRVSGNARGCWPRHAPRASIRRMQVTEPLPTAILLGVFGALLVASVIFSRATARFPVPVALVFLVIRSESTRLNSSHLVISYAVFCL